jgi:aspartyl-tRNA(Asn)/glutamyl-tRNA(Gln) amidotransferase subunit A
LIGLKTTHGLISNQGVAPLAESLDGVGLIARNIPDATEFLRHCINPSKFSEKNDINLNSQLRMQSWIPESMISSGVAAKLLAVSKEAKANVMTNDVQEFEVLSDLSEVLLQGEVCMTHQQSLISSQDNEFHPLNRLPGLKQLIFNGLAQPRKWIQIAIEQRAKRREEFILKYLSKSDVLMIPCFADSLPLAEEVNSHSQQFNFAKLLGLYRFMGFVNYLGLPSLCVPVGLDHLGRPISVQLLARPFEDFSLLNFGDIFLKSIATNKSVFSPPNPLH